MVRADDGVMGSSWLRNTDLPQTPVARRFFDFTDSITWKWRHRLTGTSSAFAGMGVAFSGEGVYDGVTNDDFYYGYEIKDAATPVDVELAWNPGPGDYSCRYSVSGAAWSSWAAIPHPTHSGPGDWYPQAWWIGSGSGLAVDIGAISVVGKPIWGCLDFMGWDRWSHSGSGWVGAPDGSGLVGGLCYGTGICRGTVLTTAVAAATAWSATSPTIRPPTGAMYKEFWFAVKNPSGANSTLKLYLRHSLSGDLLPDSQVPGNSAGIVSGADYLFASPAPSNIQKIVLSVPKQVEFYIDVQARTRDDGGTDADNPRLGGVWVTFT